MSGERCLIVNADDFGQSPGVNRGVIAAYERGIVTSASLMVRWPAAAGAAAYKLAAHLVQSAFQAEEAGDAGADQAAPALW